jgi:hypothetical protein
MAESSEMVRLIHLINDHTFSQLIAKLVLKVLQVHLFTAGLGYWKTVPALGKVLLLAKGVHVVFCLLPFKFTRRTRVA